MNQSNKKIGIGCDHAGVEYKNIIRDMLSEMGYEVTDHGTHTTDSVDYPDFVHPVAGGVAEGNYGAGVLICGSANGVSMTANKYEQVRAAICWNEEIAELARQHNNANIICIPARFISIDLAKKEVELFFNTEFEGGRHQRRVDKISDLIC